ncbi:hypothetical protein CAPTEDRAFT_186137 [Capitella teleta]|uniref:HAT C-terminal dimerisation domain-containing protein n=1 Tax=Capitella teleta TaxID=283909 RepID=R7UB46_CAPTE|nr:hypothetical protein CAPTEDRAFT_186137 [Capitella teleta]|eukprot:ELU03585.1 hypothetical protein CAPTEDRAFT_186137 [Capitella teleta]
MAPVNNMLKLIGHYDMCIDDDDAEEEIKEVSKIKDGEHHLMKELKRHVLKNVDNRFKIPSTVILASCDPALKNTLGLPREEQLNKLYAAVEAQPSTAVAAPNAPTQSAESAEEEAPVSKLQRLLLKMKNSDGSQEASQKITSEITTFLATEATTEKQEHPLRFWKDNYQRFPQIAAVAQSNINNKNMQTHNITYNVFKLTATREKNRRKKVMASINRNEVTKIISDKNLDINKSMSMYRND